MKIIIQFLCCALLIIPFSSCHDNNPNLNKSGEDELKSMEITKPIDQTEIVYEDVLYVPIYSDIYLDATTQKSLLAATLSVRNTSYADTLFISKIDYFNTNGDLVRSYVDKTISLLPMATINYVIDREDDSGGTGANFIVELSSKNKNSKPLIQAIMVGQNGNKAFSFITDAYSVK